MIAKSFKFTFLFFIAFVAMQWLFRSEIVWLDIIGISLIVFLLYILFEWSNHSNKNKTRR